MTLTKFHNDRVKIVDFLLIANFDPVQFFMQHPLSPSKGQKVNNNLDSISTTYEHFMINYGCEYSIHRWR